MKFGDPDGDKRSDLPHRGDRRFDRPAGGYAHEWNWQEELAAPVHVDNEAGIAWVRISDCPSEEQHALSNWVEERMMARPVIEGIDPQDAVYVWDYAQFCRERSDQIP